VDVDPMGSIPGFMKKKTGVMRGILAELEDTPKAILK
jgi:hypothetical protein